MRDDRGTVAVITALVSTLVLFGLGALTMDVGALYAERRQLQNGADASALAVAATCSSAVGCDASTAATATARSYADDNANDGLTGVDRVCGTGPGLAPCPGRQGPWDCQALPARLAGEPYVQVQASTRTSGGTKVAPILAQMLTGNAAYSGTTVRACARASWGGPASLISGLPVTVSECEYAATLPLEPAPPAAPAGAPRVLKLHNTDPADSCEGSRSGADLPGGFGWLATTDGCRAQADLTGWFDDKTGNSPPQPCKPADFSALVDTVVPLPIYASVNGSPGTNGAYRMAGFAAFHLTGYNLTGGFRQKDVVTGSYPCTGSTSCLSVYFVSDPQPVPGTIGGLSHGVVVVQLSG